MRSKEFEVKVQPDGSLLIIATQAGRDWLAARQQEPGAYGADAAWILQDALQDAPVGGLERGIGVLAPNEVDPNPYGQNPHDGRRPPGVVIAAGATFVMDEPNPSKWALIDDMEAERLWWFPQAEQLSPVDELRTKGAVLFEPAPAPQAKASASFGL